MEKWKNQLFDLVKSNLDWILIITQLDEIDSGKAK